MSAILIKARFTFESVAIAKEFYSIWQHWPLIADMEADVDANAKTQVLCDKTPYDLSRLREICFSTETCVMERVPQSKGKTVLLDFYCGKRTGYRFWDALWQECIKYPVTIFAHFLHDMTDEEKWLDKHFTEDDLR